MRGSHSLQARGAGGVDARGGPSDVSTHPPSPPCRSNSSKDGWEPLMLWQTSLGWAAFSFFFLVSFSFLFFLPCSHRNAEIWMATLVTHSFFFFAFTFSAKRWPWKLLKRCRMDLQMCHQSLVQSSGQDCHYFQPYYWHVVAAPFCTALKADRWRGGTLKLYFSFHPHVTESDLEKK